MAKTFLLIGHCGPDSAYLRHALKAAVPDATILSAADEADLRQTADEQVDLALVNRELGYGFGKETGVELIAQLKGSHPKLKTMLVSNHADAQAAAVAAGALPGFGKREIGTPHVEELLRKAVE
ncbi:MAG TPA: hypothetical protein VMD30_09190 [Tepidisphaeraceae bacterium]|nr:hypothetical protein [Tepidisphaeraceae bacterium]